MTRYLEFKSFSSTKAALWLLLVVLLNPTFLFAAPTITFSYQEKSGTLLKVSEGSGNIHIQATLSEPQANDVSFTYALTTGTTASRLNDFMLNIPGDPGELLGGTVTFTTGNTAASIPINVLNDRYKESDEVIRFFLSNAIGAELSTNILDIQIIDDDEIPIIILAAPNYTRNKDGSIDAAIYETDGGVNLNLEIVNNPSGSDIIVQYEMTYSPIEELDEGEIGVIPDVSNPSVIQRALTGSLSIPATLSDQIFEITVLPDALPEGQEFLVFKLLSADNAVVHATQNVLNLTINNSGVNSGAINDTGVANCYDDSRNVVVCDSALDFPRQDGSNLDINRHNRYQKLDENGDPLVDTATSWACVRDINTKLIWQAKLLPSGEIDGSLFTWYNQISSVNGGDEGFDGAQSKDGTGVSVGSTCDISRCNTSDYVKSINQNGLCGPGNWRMPKVSELLSIMDFEPDDYNGDINKTVTNMQFFKDTNPSIYWTATPISALYESAWCINFGLIAQNHVHQCLKNELHYIRLVKTDSL